MLESIRRWVGGTPEGPDWSPVAAWAARRQGVFKRARDQQGFVVDGMLDGRPWRLEWGPPQRSYIAGHELRLRMELGMPPDLQMLLMSLPLMETLERQTFERYTEQLQTQIDVATPEEMRWLAMLPKVAVPGERKFRARFGAVALAPKLALQWIEGALAARMSAAAAGPLAEDPPLVLMTLRGRLYLRLQLPEPEPDAIEAAVAVFECAAGQALRLVGSPPEGPEVWPTTATTAWQTQLQPEPAKE